MKTISLKNKYFTARDAEAKLKTAGVKPSLQRIAIFRFILCESDHPTAEEIYQWAEKHLSKISLATIYNTLNTLTEAKLIRAFHLSHSDKVIYDVNTYDHHHFLDESSGRLFDIAVEDFAYDLNLPAQFKVNHLEVVFKGTVINNPKSKVHTNNHKES